MIRLGRIILLGFTGFCTAQELSASSSGDAAGAEAEFRQHVQPVLNRYCVMCHNARLKTAGVALDGLVSAGTIAGQPGLWEKVLHKVRSGEMPPPGLPKPSPERSQTMVSWISAALDREAESHPDPGRVTVHRLNRAEYDNAIRDLLAIDFQPAADFPADDSGYGFDNVADVLSLPPVLMEKYLAAAGKAAKVALGRVHYEPLLRRLEVPRDGSQTQPWQIQGNSRSRTVMLTRSEFPADAEYLLRLRLRGAPGATGKDTLEFRIDGLLVHTSPVAFETSDEDEKFRRREFRLPVRAGKHELQVRVLIEDWQEPAAGAGTPEKPAKDTITVDWVEIAGPYNVKAPGSSDSRRLLLSCTVRSRKACATQILTRVARRAWRRPVTAAESARLLEFYRMGRAGTHEYEGGIELGLKAILVSPHFLFRIERDPPGSAPGSVVLLGDLALASRLSFFLWSSVPDEELLALAEKGQLRRPGILQNQVRRMLRNPKSVALTENFAGQWLHLRNLVTWRPARNLFPDVDDSLRNAMRREAELFFESVVREDRSVLDFLDARDTFLNDRLAQHYGIDGVRGAEFRRVQLAGTERGGVLTMAGILAVTSYPTRTSPVIRGKWVLENLLGSAPPPPPPGVPPLEEAAIGKTVTVRQQMEAHRSNPACASCHARMDPIGFALENYDAAGKWRTSEGGFPVDAGGKLPSGQAFANAAELKQILRTHPEEFLLSFTEKLMTYALGRGIERTDKPAVRAIVRNAAADDYKFTSILKGIVESVLFQMRRTGGAAARERTHVAD